MPQHTTENNRKAYNYFKNRPGEVLHYADVAETLGMEKNRLNAWLVRIVAKYPQYGISRVNSGSYVYLRQDVTDPPHGYMTPDTRSAPGLREALTAADMAEIESRENPTSADIESRPIEVPSSKDADESHWAEKVDWAKPEMGEPRIGATFEAIYILTSGRDIGATVVKDEFGNLYTLHKM